MGDDLNPHPIEYQLILQMEFAQTRDDKDEILRNMSEILRCSSVDVVKF